MSEQSKKAKITIFEKDNGFEIGMSGDLGHLAAGLAVGIEHIAGNSQNFETVMQIIREIHEKMAEEGLFLSFCTHQTATDQWMQSTARQSMILSKTAKMKHNTAT